MKKNFFDRLSDSYENFHLKESEINMGNDTIYISPKLKLTFAWILFILCCVFAYFALDLPIGHTKTIDEKEKKEITNSDVDVDEEHDTAVPYEKNIDKELNTFIQSYFDAITACDNQALQDMVTEPSLYSDDESLKKKAEFITGYNDITVYTKDGLEEGSYIAFVVANLTITGVDSSPYDIVTLYIISGERGFLIDNGSLSDDIASYIEKVKGDKDIQDVYQSVEEKNTELRQEDASLDEFYKMLSGENTSNDGDEATPSENTEGSDETNGVDEGTDDPDGTDRAGEEADDASDAPSGEVE